MKESVADVNMHISAEAAGQELFITKGTILQKNHGASKGDKNGCYRYKAY